MSDDFFSPFEHSRRGTHGDKRYYSHDGYHDEHGYREKHRDGHHGDNDLMGVFEAHARAFLRNKPLMMILALTLVLVLVIAIVLIVLFYPVLLKLWNYLLNNGLKGIIDMIQPILNLILQGQGK